MRALAYHITFGTYGTRLHFGPRPTVSRDDNAPGTPVLSHDPQLHEWMRSQLAFDPVHLTREQMCFAESVVPDICRDGYWMHHASAAGPDHVHVVLTSEHHPHVVRRILKRWLGQRLSEQWPLPEGATWWAEGGSTKVVDNPRYLTTAVNYVNRQRATR